MTLIKLLINIQEINHLKKKKKKLIKIKGDIVVFRMPASLLDIYFQIYKMDLINCRHKVVDLVAIPI